MWNCFLWLRASEWGVLNFDPNSSGRLYLVTLAGTINNVSTEVPFPYPLFYEFEFLLLGKEKSGRFFMMRNKAYQDHIQISIVKMWITMVHGKYQSRLYPIMTAFFRIRMCASIAFGGNVDDIVEMESSSVLLELCLTTETQWTSFR